ncbi:MAG TPA: tRNA (adenosine(37)-N6)-dimethylallyltransferase MiaA, partial [Candidatus Portnoybacteria bacterium]|nr:tRNA (adenosine(37)-N6)-dimethylallyltransferase MiaA [Candidatus Portnoybacteria bacterium]
MLIIVLGPTASGKTKMAIKLAKFFNGEIISADSRQIYREMNIGTDKISPLEMEDIPHYLINIINPDEEFTVAQYKKLAIQKIKEIQKRDKTPFLVGGTGLYIQSVIDNLSIPSVVPDLKLRHQLEEKSLSELQEMLKKLDFESFQKIDLNNPRRLIRALEVCLKTGQPFSQQTKKGKPLFDFVEIGISLSMDQLEQKINHRVDWMIKNDLIEEVKNLLSKYPADLPAFSGIGYQEIIQYLQKKIS